MKKIRVVCFGGGTGLSALLRGLKRNPLLEISAVVTMFDSGDSSGALRDRFGILPPGDILKCLLALSENETFTRELLLKRIIGPDNISHSSGNILLLGFEKLFNGNFIKAIDALGQILSISGRVYPITTEKSNLCARFEDNSIVKSESLIDKNMRDGKKIVELFLSPLVYPNPEVVKIIKEADVFCVGPGSFYTSVLPNFLPTGIKEEIKKSLSPIILISNLLTEGHGMTDHFTESMVKIIESYIGRFLSKVVVNTKVPPERLSDYAKEGKFPLKYNGITTDDKYVRAELWLDPELARHDSDAIGFLVSNLIYYLKN